MPQSSLTAKAQLLLARRSAPNTLWFYIGRNWQIQLLFLVAYIAIPVALWFLDFAILAMAAACFFAGAKIRDVRWFVTFSREWPTTAELLDWDKIEEIAIRPADP